MVSTLPSANGVVQSITSIFVGCIRERRRRQSSTQEVKAAPPAQTEEKAVNGKHDLWQHGVFVLASKWLDGPDTLACVVE